MFSLAYLESPDYLVVVPGSAYTSEKMIQFLSEFGVQLGGAPIETPGTIGTITKYHAPLRIAYENIRDVFGRITNVQNCLQMAIFTIRCTVRPKDLCSTLPVFGEPPRSVQMYSGSIQLEGVCLMDEVMVDLQ